MIRTARPVLAAAALSFAALLTALPAAAAPAHTKADCAALPQADRSACVHCLQRVKRHVYDSALKPGLRCIEAAAPGKK